MFGLKIEASETGGLLFSTGMARTERANIRPASIDPLSCPPLRSRRRGWLAHSHVHAASLLLGTKTTASVPRASAIPPALRAPFCRKRREVIGVRYSLLADDKLGERTIERGEKKTNPRPFVLKKCDGINPDPRHFRRRNPPLSGPAAVIERRITHPFHQRLLRIFDQPLPQFGVSVPSRQKSRSFKKAGRDSTQAARETRQAWVKRYDVCEPIAGLIQSS